MTSVEETFISLHQKKYNEYLDAMIVFKHQNNANIYYLLSNKLVLGQKIVKKKPITDKQYENMINMKKEGTEVLERQRISFFKDSFYFKIDYYPKVIDQPLILTLEKDWNDNRDLKQVEYPKEVRILEDITDITTYTKERMAQTNQQISPDELFEF